MESLNLSPLPRFYLLFLPFDKIVCLSGIHSWVLILTDFTMDGSPHSVLSSLLLWRRPCVSISLSRTSTPTTLGFMGFGYFCIAALITTSQGWLLKQSQNINILTNRNCQIHTIMSYTLYLQKLNTELK